MKKGYLSLLLVISMVFTTATFAAGSTASAEALEKLENPIGFAILRMDHHPVGAMFDVDRSSAQRIVDGLAGDQALEPRENHEIGRQEHIASAPDLAAENCRLLQDVAGFR